MIQIGRPPATIDTPIERFPDWSGALHTVFAALKSAAEKLAGWRLFHAR
jgi:hypothetical protein